MRYYTEINTDAYVDHRASKKNWEPGTVNDYMHAINHHKTSETSLLQVKWRIDLFWGTSFQSSEYSDSNPDYDENGKETNGMSPRYHKWLMKRQNTIKFYDRLCEFERTRYLSGYGFMQGYFSVDEKIQELKTYGYTRVYFSELYDIRQFDKHMKGCYMEIYKAGIDKEAVTFEYLSRMGRTIKCL